MSERRKFNTLLWKSNTFIRPYRIKKRMLTLKQANERLHRYFDNMDILVYRGTSNRALVHCKGCKQTFETSNVISTYLYGNKYECEKCKVIRLNAQYREMFKPYKDLKYLGYFYRSTNVVLRYKCKVCGEPNTVVSSNLSISNFKGCPVCAEKAQKEYYDSYLKRHNCEYLGTYYEPGNTQISVRFLCHTCGETGGKTSLSILTKNTEFSYCERCEKEQKFERLQKPFVDELRTKGFIYTGAGYSGNTISVTHLLCGKNGNQFVHNLRKPKKLCKECRGKITRGIIKEEDRELVQETLVMLKNIQAFKNAWLKQVPDALEKLDKGFIRAILEHIDGWVKNYEDIIETYPNGNLAKVIRGNPLYKQVEGTFYPIMDKIGFKR